MDNGKLTIENFNIDDVVRSVLADLKSRGDAPRACVPKNTERSDKDVFLGNRVVSVAEIRLVSEGATLFVTPKCVITPSAKDEIRKRKIRLATRLPRPETEATGSLWLATHSPEAFPHEIPERFGVKQVSFDTPENLLAAAKVCLLHENMRGVALARQTAKLLVDANRNSLLRAIPGFSPEQVVEDAYETNANLLVVHPERCGKQLMEIVHKYANR